ncbi:pyridoxamine 5'-phosphate oxidase [Clostridium zeae]|uniref:Pyridoxamine 5'-phosphate oxidase n=1 Tax=Clostridium zeae TaxID=2759022 RepID=A0ABQ1EE65_9CLOT|nr:pyridoxamine 5'-phosphate oxidase family protein [Clostridium zeae]GFZ32983.1 pyridoxamine 5'-phosphate oxidase [Clostridium zeae]
MEELLKLLKENPNGVLATVDNGKPRVRPFGFIMEEEGKFYFCTNNLKEVYKQLMKVPYIEYSVTTKDMVTLRISGEISFCDDLIIKDKVLNVHEPVKLGYKSADNPIFKVFYMEHGTATISDFSGKLPKKIEF